MRRVSNPPNPWSTTEVEWLGEPPQAQLDVHEERARSILSRNESPDVPFTWGCNPYRGCFHACAYCYARPSHQYLGWGAGTDFDRRLVVKLNAPELLAAHFARPSWTGEPVAFSGVTDPYQPLEATYGLTRRCLEVCLAHRNPVRIVTKGALIRRDVGLLAALARVAHVRVWISLAFADDRTAGALEPSASPPSARLAALAALSAAGVPTGVAVSPLIPGLNDSDVPVVLRRAAAAGATRAWMILLRLPAEVRPVFVERLREALPERAHKVLSALAEMRGGRLNDPRFGSRFAGSGPRWEAAARLFEVHARRLGLIVTHAEESWGRSFHRPGASGTLFPDA